MKLKQELLREYGQIRISVGTHDNDQIWQHVLISLGEFSDAPFSECADYWPREAIRLLRAELDRMEVELFQEEQRDVT